MYDEPLVAKTVPEPIGPVALVEPGPIGPVGLVQPEPTTIGLSTPEPEHLKLTVAALPQPHAAKRPKRKVRVEILKPRIAACIPGYDSSGAQTRPC
jgi:hypothetical protein